MALLRFKYGYFQHTQEIRGLYAFSSNSGRALIAFTWMFPSLNYAKSRFCQNYYAWCVSLSSQRYHPLKSKNLTHASQRALNRTEKGYAIKPDAPERVSCFPRNQAKCKGHSFSSPTVSSLVRMFSWRQNLYVCYWIWWGVEHGL